MGVEPYLIFVILHENEVGLVSVQGPYLTTHVQLRTALPFAMHYTAGAACCKPRLTPPPVSRPTFRAQSAPRRPSAPDSPRLLGAYSAPALKTARATRADSVCFCAVKGESDRFFMVQQT